MDLRLTGGLGNPGWAEVEACTLPTAQRPLRMAEFDDLFATTLMSVEKPDQTRARLLLAGGPALAERARRLAEAESSCCSFFTFEVTELDGALVAFDVEVPEAHVDVLAALVARAEGAQGVRPRDERD